MTLQAALILNRTSLAAQHAEELGCYETAKALRELEAYFSAAINEETLRPHEHQLAN